MVDKPLYTNDDNKRFITCWRCGRHRIISYFETREEGTPTTMYVDTKVHLVFFCPTCNEVIFDYMVDPSMMEKALKVYEIYETANK